MTDLGTEFGIEVGQDGVTDTQVFVGEVRIATPSSQGSSAEQTRVLRAGQVAHVVRSQGLSVAERRVQESPMRFVRAIPSRSSMADAYAELVLSLKPAVYYRMEKWPKSNKAGCYVLVDSAPGGHHGELHSDDAVGQPGCRGRFGGGLELRGPMVGDYATVPDYPQSDNRQLSVSAWVWCKYLDPWASIIQNWWYPGRGQFFLGIDDHYVLVAQIRVDNHGEWISVAETDVGMLPRKTWQHVAFVADGKVLRLYRNGAEVAASPCPGPTPIRCERVWRSAGIPTKRPTGLNRVGRVSGTAGWTKSPFSATHSRPSRCGSFMRVPPPPQNRPWPRLRRVTIPRGAEPPSGEEGGIDKH